MGAGTVCGMLDGALWVQGFLDAHRPDAVRILDWPHAVGYLAAVAQTLHGADTDACLAWLAGQRRTLLEGPPPPAASAIREALGYLEPRAEQIRYAAFYPIGSGAVERANKLVVAARLKGAGMWAPDNVNPLLALRGMECSGRWAEGWTQLCARWRAAAPPTAAPPTIAGAYPPTPPPFPPARSGNLTDSLRCS